jgi:uncharacterized RDD family membrane protein YckC
VRGGGYLDLPVEALPLASIGQRAVARLVDTLLFAVPGAVLLARYLEIDGDDVSIDAPFWLTLVLAAASALYEVVFIAWRGQTLGKMLLRVRVVQIDDGRIPGVAKSAIRTLVPTVAGAIPFALAPVLALGVYLYALVDRRRQGIHDKAAGTIVVHALRVDAEPPTG